MKRLEKLILLLILLFLMPTLTSAQSLDWVKTMGGTAYESGYAIAVDDAGNVYTTGAFKGTVDFDPNAGTDSLTAIQDFDIFIQKLDVKGKLVWAKSMGGTGEDEGYAITVDPTGNVYTTGPFQGTVDFDPNAGTYDLTATGSRDVFIQKLDKDGNLVWAKSLEGSAASFAHQIALDDSGNLYLAGSFEGAVDFDPGNGMHMVTSNGAEDVFILKLTANGDFLWVKSVGGLNFDYPAGIALDGAGNIYICGSFSQTVDFDPGAGTHIFSTIPAILGLFILKLDSNGDFSWAKQVYGTADTEAQGIAVDGEGNVCVIGSFSETADFNPGTDTFNLTAVGFYNIFVQKLDSNGDFIWANSMVGEGIAAPLGLSIDDSANIYTTGFFTDSIDFDPGTGISMLKTKGDFDTYIQKLDSQGNLRWVYEVGGTNQVIGQGIAVDNRENVHITGDFVGTVDFDANGGRVTTAVGDGDIFTLKLTTNGNVAIETIRPAHLRLYPNPSHGYFTIDLPSGTRGDLQVVDHLGRQIGVYPLPSSQPAVDLSHLPAGVYHVCVALDSGEKFLGKVMLK